MQQTICDLWNGEIAPGEHCGAHDTELNTLFGLMEQSREKLAAGLDENQQEFLQTYMDASEEYLLRMMELTFCEGFTLGGRLVTEILV